MCAMKTVFVSGHLDLTDAEFHEHYAKRLWALSEEPGTRFIVGDAPGADTMAQKYLKAIGVTDITVYHMLEAPRNWCGVGSLAGGFASDKERDAAMTSASTCDVAWVRPGREKSGTAKNLSRRVAKR